MKVTILGSAASTPSATRGLTSQYVETEERKLLFDCGEGTQRALLTAGGNVMDLDSIYITHFHGDHIFGLPGLLNSMSVLKREKQLKVFGPDGIMKLMDEYKKLIERKLPFTVTAVPLPPMTSVGEAQLAVTPFLVQHRVRAQGYAVVDTQTGKKLVISGDTEPCEGTRIAAYKADILIHEATFMDKDVVLARGTGHSTARAAGQIAKEAEVDLLLLTHLSTRYRVKEVVEEAREAHSKTMAVRDGMSMEV